MFVKLKSFFLPQNIWVSSYFTRFYWFCSSCNKIF